jgi:uncharacterized protein
MRMGPMVGGGLGGVIILIAALVLGVDPRALLEQAPSAGVTPADSAALANDPGSVFVSQVLADTEDTWEELFAREGSSYQEPRLVLFSGMVQSACGTAQSAVGPVLLPARPAHLHRPELLRGPAPTLRRRW